MIRLPSTLICTVGTSLFVPNLVYLNPSRQYVDKPSSKKNIVTSDKVALERSGLWQDRERLISILEEIKSLYEKKEWNRLGAYLTYLPPDLRLCGAEINSIEAMIRKGFISKNRELLILLVSDTEDGNSIGKILTSYFTHKRCTVGFLRCEYITVRGLQDEKPLVFQREGLTNLVRLLGEQLRKWGTENIAINATGGYKAQIALAVAFGQATKCPVYYKHERFDQIIRFPRSPFTMDLSLVDEYLKLWANLAEEGATFSEKEIEHLFPENNIVREAIYPMLDVIEESGEKYYSLSALGMVYWEAFQTLNPELSLQPEKARQKKGVHFRQDHYPKGFEEFVGKVYENFPDFITECHSLPYTGQRGISRTRFYMRGTSIIGEYVDRTGFGARFEIMTSAQNALERKWIIDQLNKWLKKEA